MSGAAQDPRGERLERAAWLLLLALAALWRFADLGTRAMSHDESLHAYYSWRYAELGEYRHDPLLHGPLLFHAQALVFLLFGDGDATARLLPAAAGVLLVGAPWLFRRELGRRGALAAGVLLLVSPAVAYYSRYLRNDVWCALFALLWARALLDYRARGEPAAIARLALAMALSFAAKEVAFLTGAGFGAICLAGTARATRWRESRWLDLAIVQAALVAPYLAAVAILAAGGHPADADAVGATARAVAWGGGLGAAALAGALAWFGARGRPLARAPLTAFAIFWGCLLPLYTGLGSNLARGLASGIAGSLGYWLAQQGVQRGAQPVYFYALLALLYEPLVWGLSIAGAVAALRGALASRSPASSAAGEAGRARVRRLLALWSAAAWVGYSLAGERMPWLLVHVVVPSALLAGAWLEDRLPTRPTADETRPIGALALAVAASVLLGAGLIARDPPLAARIVRSALLLGLVLGGAGWLRRRALLAGPAAARRIAAYALLGAALLLGARTALIACFAHGQLAVEPLVYAHGTPAVKPALADLERASRRIAGGLDLEVAYDFETSWPLAWYLRDYPRAHGFAAPPDAGALAAPALLLGDAAERALAERLGDRERIPFDILWWPVDGYRGWAIGDLFRLATDPSSLRRGVAFYFFRELPGIALDPWPLRKSVTLFLPAPPPAAAPAPAPEVAPSEPPTLDPDEPGALPRRATG